MQQSFAVTGSSGGAATTGGTTARPSTGQVIGSNLDAGLAKTNKNLVEVYSLPVDIANWAIYNLAPLVSPILPEDFDYNNQHHIPNPVKELYNDQAAQKAATAAQINKAGNVHPLVSGLLQETPNMITTVGMGVWGWSASGAIAAARGPIRLPTQTAPYYAVEREGTGSNSVTVDSKKFSEYIFKDGAAPGKDVVYKNLGYGINDSETLSQLYQNQAAANYASGNYTLGNLTEYGQIINIEIKLPGIGSAAGNTSYLKSGWMINPDNSIRLVTPLAGFTR